MKEIKVGAIGVGDMFIHGHLPAYATLPETRLVALADPSEVALKRALVRIKELFTKEADKFKGEGRDDVAERLIEIVKEIKVYRDYREMLDKEELDLVDVCTPHRYHKPIVIDSLRAGAHVMVEKPMARTYIEALDIVEAVKETDRLFQLNENYIFAGGCYKARKLIELGELGEVEYAVIPCSHDGPEWREWFWSPVIGGGGSLLDLGSHAIGVAWYLIGFNKEPKVVKAEKFVGISLRIKNRYIAGKYRTIEVEDDAHVLVRFEDNEDGSWSTALIEASWSGAELESAVIFGSKGTLKIKGAQGKTLIDITDYVGRKRVLEAPHRNSVVLEIANMCKCILDEEKSLLNEEVGAEIMAIIDAAYYSEIKGRRAVTLDEFKDFAMKLIEKYGAKASDEFIKMKIRRFKECMRAK